MFWEISKLFEMENIPEFFCYFLFFKNIIIKFCSIETGLVCVIKGILASVGYLMPKPSL